jgi:hypothetical protein
MNFDNLLNTDLRKMFPPEAITSFLVMAIIIDRLFLCRPKRLYLLRFLHRHDGTAELHLSR